MKRRNFIKGTLLSATTVSLGACDQGSRKGGGQAIRFGHFPNVTHLQSLVARSFTRAGEGWFEKRLNKEVEWFTYNAGPSAMEAIFARSLDVTYIGPSPVLNAFAKSKGTEPRVLAGAAKGGSSLLVRPGAGIAQPADFRGKRIATPQLGNTQDIQARAWLIAQGFHVTQTGGDVQVIPTPNADQLALFQKGDLDAVWTVEPWASLLELRADAEVLLGDRETTVTLLAARAGWLEEDPALAASLTNAHRELTDWILANQEETLDRVGSELKELAGAAPDDTVLAHAVANVVVTNDVSVPDLEKMVRDAQTVGFLKDIPPVASLMAAPEPKAS